MSKCAFGNFYNCVLKKTPTSLRDVQTESWQIGVKPESILWLFLSLHPFLLSHNPWAADGGVFVWGILNCLATDFTCPCSFCLFSFFNIISPHSGFLDNFCLEHWKVPPAELAFSQETAAFCSFNWNQQKKMLSFPVVLCVIGMFLCLQWDGGCLEVQPVATHAFGCFSPKQWLTFRKL